MFNVNDWVVPSKTKTIVQIEALETYDDVTIAYTNDRKAYPIDRLETLRQAYDRETNKANL